MGRPGLPATGRKGARAHGIPTAGAQGAASPTRVRRRLTGSFSAGTGREGGARDSDEVSSSEGRVMRGGELRGEAGDAGGAGR
jgi:hypothetical protein